jgi:hypothetical protein
MSGNICALNPRLHIGNVQGFGFPKCKGLRTRDRNDEKPIPSAGRIVVGHHVEVNLRRRAM